ncbi:MAG: hypothetical protein ACTSR1_00115 [Candidatus Heimdallarchaeota archaeon]
MKNESKEKHVFDYIDMLLAVSMGMLLAFIIIAIIDYAESRNIKNHNVLLVIDGPSSDKNNFLGVDNGKNKRNRINRIVH